MSCAVLHELYDTETTLQMIENATVQSKALWMIATTISRFRIKNEILRRGKTRALQEIVLGRAPLVFAPEMINNFSAGQTLYKVCIHFLFLSIVFLHFFCCKLWKAQSRFHPSHALLLARDFILKLKSCPNSHQWWIRLVQMHIHISWILWFSVNRNQMLVWLLPSLIVYNSKKSQLS